MSAATSGSATAVEQGHNSARAGGRTSKSALIEALAAELKREKERGRELSAELDQTEQVLNRKHDNLLAIEADYEAKSRRNEQVIANLRRDLEKAKQKLEEASHCDEVEASQYLSLITGDGQSRPRPHPIRPQPSDVQPSFSRETDAAFQSPLPPPLLRPRSPERPRYTVPRPTPSAAERTQERLQRLDERLADRVRVASPTSPPPRTRKTSITANLANQLSDQLGLSSSRGGREQKSPARREASAETPAGAGGLARSGSRLGRLFPTLGRK